MKLSPLIFSVLLLACCPSSAAQDERFVEFSYVAEQTLIYDLATVRVLQPGRFTIVRTLIANANRMAFELKVLETLRTYCKHPDGKYPAPTDLFTLAPPDLPVKSIEVKTETKDQYKAVSWYYPYKNIGL